MLLGLGLNYAMLSNFFASWTKDFMEKPTNFQQVSIRKSLCSGKPTELWIFCTWSLCCRAGTMFPGLWHRSIGPMVHEVATFSKPWKRCLSHGTACQSLSIFCIQNNQVLVFGTRRDNHNMGKGRHSQWGTFHCLSLAQLVLANMLCWMFLLFLYFNSVHYWMRNSPHQERYTKFCINVLSWIAWQPCSKHCSLGIVYHAELDFELLL